MALTKIVFLFFFCLSLHHKCVLTDQQITSKGLTQNSLEEDTETSNLSVIQPFEEEKRNNE